ncbi:MAG: hypothetical protein ACC618_00885 [Patescibacteria group bacterium]
MDKELFVAVTKLANAQMMGMGTFGNMMDGNASGYRWPIGGLHTALIVITWLSLIAFLIAGARWFWKKAGK